MPGYLTDNLNNKILDLLFGSVPLAPISNLYFGLSQATANKSGTLSEPAVGGYARVSVANTIANFPTAVSGTKSNAVVISFPVPTADWGTVLSLFVADAASGGNILAMADLTLPRLIGSGSSPAKVAVGAFYFSHT